MAFQKCSGKKKQNQEEKQEKMGVVEVHAIGDCSGAVS